MGDESKKPGGTMALDIGEMDLDEGRPAGRRPGGSKPASDRGKGWGRGGGRKRDDDDDDLPRGGGGAPKGGTMALDVGSMDLESDSRISRRRPGGSKARGKPEKGWGRDSGRKRDDDDKDLPRGGGGGPKGATMALDVGGMDLDGGPKAKRPGARRGGGQRSRDLDDELPTGGGRRETRPMPPDPSAGGDAPAALDLRIVDPDGGERLLRIEGNLCRVGRETDNDLVLVDMRASRHHVELRRRGDGFELQDLGSGNGTLLNDQQASRSQLADGDVIKIGKTEIHVVVEASGLAGAPPPSVPQLMASPPPTAPPAPALFAPAAMPAPAPLMPGPELEPATGGSNAAVVFIVFGGVGLLLVAFLASLVLFLVSSSGEEEAAPTAALDVAPPELSGLDYDGMTEPLVKVAGTRYDQGEYLVARRMLKAVLRVHPGSKRAAKLLARVERALQTRGVVVTFEPESPRRKGDLTVRVHVGQPMGSVRATFADAPLPMELSKDAPREYVGRMKVPRRLRPGEYQLDVELRDLEDETFEVARRITVR